MIKNLSNHSAIFVIFALSFCPNLYSQANELILGNFTELNVPSSCKIYSDFITVSEFAILSIQDSNSIGQGTIIRWIRPNLPVELAEFVVKVNSNSILLNWTTKSELNNQGFVIERKIKNSNNEPWQEIAFIDGKGTSSEINFYQFEDSNVRSGKYNYRLKQIDFNGDFHYSDVLEVFLNSPDKFILKQNYPNPFNPSTKIEYYIPEDGEVNIEISNIIGEKVNSLTSFCSAGVNQYNFNAQNLVSGVYICTITFNGVSLSNKMNLIK